MRFQPLCGLLCLAALLAGPARAAPRLHILAAENFYGSIAAAIAGPQAEVSCVLNNPNQDPHDFEASPAIAREVASADLVLVNGLDYDPWMDRLLAASPRPGRAVIRVADLLHAAPGGNPHIWYDPSTMPAVAEAVTARLAAWDPTDDVLFQQREKSLLARLQQISATVAHLKQAFAGTPVTATEPIFDLMASAVGFTMRNERFQWAVMNGTEPRAGDVAKMEDDLRHRRVRILFTNAQVTDAATTRLVEIARHSAIPVIGVTETMPPGEDYTGWMLDQLAAVRAALVARK